MPVADEAATESDQELDFVPGPGLALTGRLGTSEDSELDEPLPNAERLVAQAVALAGADYTTAPPVDRFWRFPPQQEPVGYTPEGEVPARGAPRRAGNQRPPRPTQP